MRKDIERVLLSEEQIQEKVKELAETLSTDYAGKDPVIIGVLKGVVMFFSDVVKHIDIPCQIDFMCISSYQGTQSKEMNVKMDVTSDIKGRHVIILEDIFDTGNSLDFTYKHLMQKEPASIRICTLLDKPERRNPKVTLVPDYVGYTIPNEFVVGYGLDCDEHYRNLPYVGVLNSEAYQ